MLSGLLLTACQADNPAAATKAAVATYLGQQHPAAGYQALRWGPGRPWRQADADSLRLLRVQHAEDSLSRWWRRHYATPVGAHFSPAYVRRIHSRQDSLTRRIGTLLRIPRDTTRLGTVVQHTYRLRTATGQLARDSAWFVVLRQGRVSQLPKLKSAEQLLADRINATEQRPGE